ncbi:MULTISPECIES: SMI1/KNR4 family protein [unclassified Modicisalibacter]|uniref:SMI1/KNR4 family protein n=1 Tax=unclassified Modicisalibacter TaxID=2679913 RepID=UPI001CCF94A5|nr:MULTISPECIES: SMI1/KNR4 family protein [unclassified Modicisalibacter]MBZ9558059.1 SMI1/KNR4 family protein [Modicisalibacter sp. R2A 31.J]MBZ9573272.1 SMI1/KNR4 family protein [Modicisalibacter sp. MOD 31.J]
MLLEICNTGKNLSLSDFEEVERKLKKPLPMAYKKFLLKHNGGEPRESYIDFDAEKLNLSGQAINVFYGLGVQPCDDIVHKIGSIGDQIPEGVIFIADTAGGDHFLLSLRKDSYGEIFYKDHEFEDLSPFEPSKNILPESIVKVANTFSDFLDALYGDE